MQGAGGGLVLGLVVVEPLADLEGREHVGARLLDRGGEPGHGRVPEVAAGGGELLGSEVRTASSTSIRAALAR